MIQHSQLNEIQFSEAIKQTETYKSFPVFKQGLISKLANVTVLYDRYHTACKWGIEQLLQNPNIFMNDVKIIFEVISPTPVEDIENVLREINRIAMSNNEK